MKNNAGFTMIEMMLSMAFVAFLMVTIAMTTISMAQTYEKGLTLNSVNKSGRAIISDMQSTIQQSSGGVTERLTSTGGFICFGNFTYAYNTGAALAAGSSSLLTYGDVPLRGEQVHLAKIPDAGGSFCSGSSTVVTGATELLPAGDRNLAIQSIKVPSTSLNPNHTTLQTLYQINFVLGTNDQGALVITGDNCRPPAGPGSDATYCAVNKFQFIVRAGGSK